MDRGCLNIICIWNFKTTRGEWSAQRAGTTVWISSTQVSDFCNSRSCFDINDQQQSSLPIWLSDKTTLWECYYCNYTDLWWKLRAIIFYTSLMSIKPLCYHSPMISAENPVSRTLDTDCSTFSGHKSSLDKDCSSKKYISQKGMDSGAGRRSIRITDWSTIFKSSVRSKRLSAVLEETRMRAFVG